MFLPQRPMHVFRSCARAFRRPWHVLPRPMRYAVLGVAASLLSVLFVRLPAPLFGDPESAILVASDGSLLGARIASDGQWRFPAGHDVPDKFATAITTYALLIGPFI